MDEQYPQWISEIEVADLPFGIRTRDVPWRASCPQVAWGRGEASSILLQTSGCVGHPFSGSFFSLGGREGEGGGDMCSFFFFLVFLLFFGFSHGYSRSGHAVEWTQPTSPVGVDEFLQSGKTLPTGAQWILSIRMIFQLTVGHLSEHVK